MSRYYLCPVIGSGKKGDAYRSKAADHGVSHVSVIPSLADGSPAQSWCLTMVDTADHAPLLADAELTPLPALKLADAWVGARLDERLAVIAKTDELGISLPLTDFGAVVRAIGEALDPAFDPHATWVHTPPE